MRAAERWGDPLAPLYIDYLVGVNILIIKPIKYRDRASALTRNGCNEHHYCAGREVGRGLGVAH